MAQSTKGLPHKHKNLSLTLERYFKNLTWWHILVILLQCRQRQADFWGSLASPVSLASSQPLREPVRKQQCLKMMPTYTRAHPHALMKNVAVYTDEEDGVASSFSQKHLLNIY